MGAGLAAVLFVAGCSSSRPDAGEGSNAARARPQSFEFDGLKVDVVLRAGAATFTSMNQGDTEARGEASVPLHDDGYAAYVASRSDAVHVVVVAPSGTELSGASAELVDALAAEPCGDRTCIQFEVPQLGEGEPLELVLEDGTASGTLTVEATPNGTGQAVVGPIR